MNADDALILLSDNLDVFAEQIESLAAGGRYWWFRPSDISFHATTDYIAPAEGDWYLMDASPAWLAQWPDLTAAAYGLIDALIAEMNRPVGGENG